MMMTQLVTSVSISLFYVSVIFYFYFFAFFFFLAFRLNHFIPESWNGAGGRFCGSGFLRVHVGHSAFIVKSFFFFFKSVRLLLLLCRQLRPLPRTNFEIPGSVLTHRTQSKSFFLSPFLPKFHRRRYTPLSLSLFCITCTPATGQNFWWRPYQKVCAIYFQRNRSPANAKMFVLSDTLRST